MNQQSNSYLDTNFFLEKSIKIINPCVERIEINVTKNDCMRQIYLGQIEANFKGSQVLSNLSKIRLSLSIFDSKYKKFVGRTWVGPLRSIELKNSLVQCNFDESIYFVSSSDSANFILIIEFVAVLQKNVDKCISLGWTIIRLFENQSTNKSEIYEGTPRALLFIEDPYEMIKSLTRSKESYIHFSCNVATQFINLIKLLPENVLLSRFDITEELNRTKTLSIENLNSHPQTSILIEDLVVHLNLNITTFEQELVKLVADDKGFWDRDEIESSKIKISERRIKIGLHNSWKFLNERNIAQLSIDDIEKENKIKTDNTSIKLHTSSEQHGGILEEKKSKEKNRLIMEKNVLFDEVLVDSNCSIVFEIEYSIIFPKNGNSLNNNKKKYITDNSVQYETHNILIRGGVYSPFLNKDIHSENECEVNLFGNSATITTNPDFRLLYKKTLNLPNHKVLMKAPGKIVFKLKNINQIGNKKIKQEKFQANDPVIYSSIAKEEKNSISKQSDNSQFRENKHNLINNLNSQKSHYEDQFNTNLLLNQFMSQTIANNGQNLLGIFGANLELYPIYNPSLYMPIQALAISQKGYKTMSRAAYSKLHSANFPPILDRFGKLADVIDGNSNVKLNMQREEVDMLTCNQIVIQFLAFSRLSQSMKTSSSEIFPKKIFLTFQFYRFPEFKTTNLLIDNIIEDFSINAEYNPFVLKTSNKSDKSGYMICYSVDPTNLKYGEKKLFLQYLAHHAMFIDVWDANSLHLIGTATLQLKDLLRQGKEAVQSTYELDIIKMEYEDDGSRIHSENNFKNYQYENDSHSKIKGHLHIRVGNVGMPFETKNDQINLYPIETNLQQTRVISSKITINELGNNVVAKKIDEASQEGLISHNISKAHHMVETFKDIRAALVSEINTIDSNITDPVKKRKLQRMEMVRKLTHNSDIFPILVGNHRSVIEEREKDLKIIEFYRNQTKHDQIINKLKEFTTTEYAIYPNFGIVEFFEFVITNPFNDLKVITIIIEDSDIQVITDSSEWRHLKALNKIYSKCEDNMFNLEEIDYQNKNIKYPQVFLRPKETVNIPFKFQTFKADNRVQNKDLNHDEFDTLIRKIEPNYEIRKSHIWFRTDDQNPIAILRLIIDQQPHVINQTFRFNECENSFLKKTIRLSCSTRALASESTTLLISDLKLEGTSTDLGMSQLYVRSSEPNCICESRPVLIGEPHDIFFKIPTGASPSIKKFFLAIYADKYLAIPLQIWQIYVHALHRIDVSCIQGQTNRFSLILKGAQSSRIVKCFPSCPNEMKIFSQEEFLLGSNEVQELNVGVQPKSSGIKHYYLNVVDTAIPQLIHSWYIYINAKPPLISKSFELSLPVIANIALTPTISQKRVSYTNPYSTEKSFNLTTNREDLLTFKERYIKFMPNEQKTLALKFLPSQLTGFVEIYVFINNENDKNEETFSIKVHYTNHSIISKNI